MAKTIAVTNQKGGVGKTTTAINLADGLTHCGYSVLLVDLDPQCNSTSTYQAVVEGKATLYDVMKGECGIWDAIQRTAFGDILVGDSLLDADQYTFMSKPNGYMLIKMALKSVQDDYDYIIIDTPPNLGVFMINALNAADGIIVPVCASKYALDGLARLLSTFSDCKNSTNPELINYGVLLTMYDGRNTLDRDVAKNLPDQAEAAGFPLFNHVIRKNQTIGDAQAECVSLFDNYPSSHGAIDYSSLVKELISEKIV